MHVTMSYELSNLNDLHMLIMMYCYECIPCMEYDGHTYVHIYTQKLKPCMIHVHAIIDKCVMRIGAQQYNSHALSTNKIL